MGANMSITSETAPKMRIDVMAYLPPKARKNKSIIEVLFVKRLTAARARRERMPIVSFMSAPYALAIIMRTIMLLILRSPLRYVPSAW